MLLRRRLFCSLAYGDETGLERIGYNPETNRKAAVTQRRILKAAKNLDPFQIDGIATKTKTAVPEINPTSAIMVSPFCSSCGPRLLCLERETTVLAVRLSFAGELQSQTRLLRWRTPARPAPRLYQRSIGGRQRFSWLECSDSRATDNAFLAGQDPNSSCVACISDSFSFFFASLLINLNPTLASGSWSGWSPRIVGSIFLFFVIRVTHCSWAIVGNIGLLVGRGSSENLQQSIAALAKIGSAFRITKRQFRGGVFCHANPKAVKSS